MIYDHPVVTSTNVASHRVTLLGIERAIQFRERYTTL